MNELTLEYLLEKLISIEKVAINTENFRPEKRVERDLEYIKQNILSDIK